jgi:3-dehydroquinate synthase class II
MNGIVVSTNTYAETLTMTIEGGVHHTAKVKGEALKTLGMLHAGDEVAVLCHDHNGQHEAVTIIKVTKEARGSYRH